VKDPYRNAASDIRDAEEYLNETFDVISCREEKRTCMRIADVLRYDDYSSWGQWRAGELIGLSPADLHQEFVSFRGEAWATQAEAWKKDGVPAIVLAEFSGRGRERDTSIADGRGRVSFAVGMRIPQLHTIILTCKGGEETREASEVSMRGRHRHAEGGVIVPPSTQRPPPEFEVVEYTLPIYWASYLINGDASGLGDGEQEEIDEWVEREGNPEFVDVGEETWFARYNDATNMGGDVATYTAHVYERGARENPLGIAREVREAPRGGFICMGRKVAFVLRDTNREIEAPRDFGMLYDSSGTWWPSCSLLVTKFKRGRSVDNSSDAKAYFGRKIRVTKGYVELPPKSVSQWKEIGPLHEIFYDRAGDRAPGPFRHEFNKPRGSWKLIHLIKGKAAKDPAILFRLGRTSTYRIELPDGCIVDDRGIAVP
jgi:hypothetical protein